MNGVHDLDLRLWQADVSARFYFSEKTENCMYYIS